MVVHVTVCVQMRPLTTPVTNFVVSFLVCYNYILAYVNLYSGWPDCTYWMWAVCAQEVKSVKETYLLEL